MGCPHTDIYVAERSDENGPTGEYWAFCLECHDKTEGHRSLGAAAAALTATADMAAWQEYDEEDGA